FVESLPSPQIYTPSLHDALPIYLMFLENKTLKELHEIAKKYGLTSVAGLKKAEIVVRIQKLVESQAQTLLDFEGQTSMESTKQEDRKSTRLNSSHVKISYAVFCL